MGETIIEKIIRHNTGKAVKPGDIVTVNVDRCMIHDIFIPFVADKFEEMGFTKLHDPDKVVLIYDHLVPASQQDDTRHFHKGDEFVEKYGLTHVHRSDGICHQLMTEAGYVKPGDIAFGTDSHTTTYGCVGAFSSGIGYTEMASILGTGTMWIKVPETIKVVIDGELPENVMSKDIILRLIGDLRADGATYRALEFSGNELDKLSYYAKGGEITKEIIDNMATKCLQARIYDLSKYVVAGKSGMAYDVLNVLFEMKEEPIIILSAISGVYVDMYRVKCAKSAGFGFDDVAKYYNYRGREFALRNATRDCANLSLEQLRTSLDEISKTDVKLKSTAVDKKLLLEELIIKLILTARGVKYA